MKHITILVPDGQSNLNTVASIVGASEIFAEASAYWKRLADVISIGDLSWQPATHHWNMRKG